MVCLLESLLEGKLLGYGIFDHSLYHVLCALNDRLTCIDHILRHGVLHSLNDLLTYIDHILWHSVLHDLNSLLACIDDILRCIFHEAGHGYAKLRVYLRRVLHSDGEGWLSEAARRD